MLTNFLLTLLLLPLRHFLPLTPSLLGASLTLLTLLSLAHCIALLLPSCVLLLLSHRITLLLASCLLLSVSLTITHGLLLRFALPVGRRSLTGGILLPLNGCPIFTLAVTSLLIASTFLNFATALLTLGIPSLLLGRVTLPLRGLAILLLAFLLLTLSALLTSLGVALLIAGTVLHCPLTSFVSLVGLTTPLIELSALTLGGATSGFSITF